MEVLDQQQKHEKEIEEDYEQELQGDNVYHEKERELEAQF